MPVSPRTIDTNMSLDEISITINNLVQQGGTTAHQIGTLYNQVVNRKLAELAGYKSAQEFFNLKVEALSQSTLSTYGTVARNFAEALCTNFGVYHLRALLRYVEASGVEIDTGNPGPTPIDVPGDDGTVVAKPFAECSVDEVDRATRAKKAGVSVRVPVPDAARLLFLEDSLFQHFKGVAEVRFTARSEGGKTLLNLQDVPLSEVARLIQALQQGQEGQLSLTAKALRPAA